MDAGLADHFVEGFRRVDPLSELDLDKPVRFAVFQQLDPGLRMSQILIKIKTHFTEKLCDVPIRPVG